jgi:hypothetical protein
VESHHPIGVRADHGKLVPLRSGHQEILTVGTSGLGEVGGEHDGTTATKVSCDVQQLRHRVGWGGDHDGVNRPSLPKAWDAGNAMDIGARGMHADESAGKSGG